MNIKHTYMFITHVLYLWQLVDSGFLKKKETLKSIHDIHCCLIWNTEFPGFAFRCKKRLEKVDKGKDGGSPLSTIMRGISFSAGDEHLIRFPSTKPFISARSSKVQLTPAESSGTLWASNTNCKRKTEKEAMLTSVKILFTPHYLYGDKPAPFTDRQSWLSG